MSTHLVDEARAFDERIRERLAQGHVPDLRRAEPCDWFYNNPWRRPYLVEQVLGEYFRFARTHVAGTRILEVGCGPGHMSLELARHGFHVTGIDVSPASIETAQRMAEENPYAEGFGSLDYVVTAFENYEPSAPFDTVCFFCSLHHFEDADAIVAAARDRLNDGGRIVVVEPARDLMTPADAALVYLIRALLSAGARWHTSAPMTSELEVFQSHVDAILTEYRDARDAHEAEQSPHDNACTTQEMIAALKRHFCEIANEPGFAFYHRVGGGVRSPNELETKELASFLHLFDHFAVKTGLMHPGMLYWAGQAKENRP